MFPSNRLDLSGAHTTHHSSLWTAAKRKHMANEWEKGNLPHLMTLSAYQEHVERKINTLKM